MTKSEITTLRDKFTDLDGKVRDIANDVKNVASTLEKIEKFVDENRSGIVLATTLNSKITAAILTGIVLAGIAAAKGGF